MRKKQCPVLKSIIKAFFKVENFPTVIKNTVQVLLKSFSSLSCLLKSGGNDCLCGSSLGCGQRCLLFIMPSPSRSLHYVERCSCRSDEVVLCLCGPVWSQHNPSRQVHAAKDSAAQKRWQGKSVKLLCFPEFMFIKSLGGILINIATKCIILVRGKSRWLHSCY